MSLRRCAISESQGCSASHVRMQYLFATGYSCILQVFFHGLVTLRRELEFQVVRRQRSRHSSHRGRDRSLRFFQSQGWESLRRIPTVSFMCRCPPLKVEEKTTNSNWLCSARIRHLVVDALSASSCHEAIVAVDVGNAIKKETARVNVQVSRKGRGGMTECFIFPTHARARARADRSSTCDAAIFKLGSAGGPLDWGMGKGKCNRG